MDCVRVNGFFMCPSNLRYSERDKPEVLLSLLLRNCLFILTGRILDGSPAERSGKLNIGDKILAVNKVSTKNLNHESIINLIKESKCNITLTVQMCKGKLFN